MSQSDPPKILCLICNHFPWGRPGFPALPVDQSPDSLQTAAKAWIDLRLRELGFQDTALALHARVQMVIDEVEASLPRHEKQRLFYRSDLFHLAKSPEAVLDKMARDWGPSTSQRPRIGFDSFHTEIEDLARFRIVLNFLSDVGSVCGRLEEPYRCRPEDMNRLSEAQRSLYEEYALRDHKFQNLVERAPEDRTSGERCRKAIFYPRKAPHIKVEVQIQTMLQEAWDKKDHFLIYEPKRRGEEIDPNHRIEIYAMSELLYVADLTFDRLLEAIRTRRAGTA